MARRYVPVATRRNMPASKMGLPNAKPRPKYPMQDAAHARNAKARVAQQVRKGNATPAQQREVDRKANRIIKKAGGHPSPVPKRRKS